MKYYPEKEGQADGHPGILEGVQSLKVCGFVDGDVSVDCHADDDIDRAGHEGVDEGEHEVGGEEGGGVVSAPEPLGDVHQGGHGRDHHAEVGHREAQQVHVHHTLQVGPGVELETNLRDV